MAKRIKQTPPKWADVYPQGTMTGDEEQKFFIALARNKKYEWRSVDALVKESKLTKERVEQIISKYFKKGIVVQSPKNDDLWAYWERVPELLEEDIGTISDKDKDARVDAVNQP
jgi:hypothetical protein